MNEKNLVKEIENLRQEVNDIRELAEKRRFKNIVANLFSKMNVIVGILISLIMSSLVLYAAQVMFSTGQVIEADDMNNNFNELYDVAWSKNGDDLYYNDGNIGVGTDTPEADLSVDGDLQVTGNIRNPGRVFFIASDSRGWVNSSGGWIHVLYDTVTSGNEGNWYDATTGVFTAPVTGVYFFHSLNYVHYSFTRHRIHHVLGCNGEWLGASCGLAVDGNYTVFGYPNGSDSSTSFTHLVHLDEGETVQVNVHTNGDHYMYGKHSNFSGVLLSAD